MGNSTRHLLKIINIVITVLVALFVVFTFSRVRESINRFWTDPNGTNEHLMSVLSDVKEMTRLSSMEVERVVPLKDTIGNLGVFAMGRFRATISFDIESMRVEQRGDTIIAFLPPEKITLLEEEKQGFRVIDTWGLDLKSKIAKPRLSNEQENRLRLLAQSKMRSELYEDGTVQRARESAMSTLNKIYTMAPGVVVVHDRTPEGALSPKLIEQKVVTISDRPLK